MVNLRQLVPATGFIVTGAILIWLNIKVNGVGLLPALQIMLATSIIVVGIRLIIKKKGSR
jgi:hypothetical protein